MRLPVIHRFFRTLPLSLLALSAVLLSLQFLTHNSLAHGGLSQPISLSPASTDVSIDPGTSFAESLDVINKGADSRTITLSTTPYYVNGSNYDPMFTQLPGTIDASQWIKLSLTTITAERNASITVPYTIDVPVNTPAGGYYAVIFAETSSESEKSGELSHDRVGNILYITVNGDIKSSGFLTGPSLPMFSFTGKVQMTTKIGNTGGTHFIASALYTVDDMFGRPVYTSTTERYVLPQTERVITTDWQSRSLFGIYTVHRSAIVAGASKSLPDEHIVIINPWLFVALTFIIGIVVGIPVWRAIQRRKLKKPKKNRRK